MKNILLKPPAHDGEIIFLPAPREVAPLLARQTVATAHQPYFFNPGIALKFLFVTAANSPRKKIIFVDTDRVMLRVLIPATTEGSNISVPFIVDEKILCEYPAPSQGALRNFFFGLESTLREKAPDIASFTLKHITMYKEILISRKHVLLKHLLAESFLKYYSLDCNFSFISELTQKKEFFEFFNRIYCDADYFRQVFNEALDDYRRAFRFRFKHFPFPLLAHDELPFWIVHDGIRQRLFRSNVTIAEAKRSVIVPRAAALTLYLRLHEADLFLHGVGGANYEWVGDRIIEKFYKQTPNPFLTLSGTFLLKNTGQRDCPFFFYAPQAVHKAMNDFFLHNFQ